MSLGISIDGYPIVSIAMHLHWMLLLRQRSNGMRLKERVKEEVCKKGVGMWIIGIILLFEWLRE